MHPATDPYRLPGHLILELLEARGWTQRTLASVIGVGGSSLSKIITGAQPVTATIALSLGEVFGVEPEQFLVLQHQYDLAKARLFSRRSAISNSRGQLAGLLPISEMNSRGWINAPNPKDLDRIESELIRYFGVSALAEIEVMPHAARKTAFASPPSPEEVAWLYRVRQIAQSIIPAGAFSDISARSAVRNLDELLAAPEEIRRVPRILSDSGIRFVVVESLKGAKIDGVCFWLDDRSPVIGMTTRHDRIDNFWFVLRHELEHVIRRHGRDAIAMDVELEGARAGVGADVPEEERIANSAAASFCVPPDKLKMFMDRKAPFFPERDVKAFARMIDVHPGLIVGQIQHKTERYNLLRKHLAKVRSFLLPSAFVDGWGDAFPIES